MFKVKTPASCGEFIQGFNNGTEMLISCPINIYNEIYFTKGKFSANTLNHKSIQAINLFHKKFDIDKKYLKNTSIEIDSKIPEGKGMASSSADIGGIIAGLCHLYNLNLTNSEIAEICTTIEPTDSTIFKVPTLFNHISGKIINQFNWEINLNILILEPKIKINTINYRLDNIQKLTKKNNNSQSFNIFKKAIEQQSYKLLGEATILSATENQIWLNKPYLSKIIEISLNCGCYGLNIAHSGSIIAIYYNKIDISELVKQLKNNKILNYYSKQYFTNSVNGGSTIVNL